MKENAFNTPTFLEFGAWHVTGKNWGGGGGGGGGGVALMIWPIRECASGPVMDFDLFA